MSYHRFKDEDGFPYGSFEVFYHDGDGTKGDVWLDAEGEAFPEGWYWWACFPGCMPDGEPVGPFDTELAALTDAQEEQA
jgi:hypothetical protein